MIYAVFICTLMASNPQYHDCKIQDNGPNMPIFYYQSIDDCKKAAAPFNAAAGKPTHDVYAKAICMGKSDWQPMQ